MLAQRQFTPLLRRAGLPAIRFYDLRHTAATILLATGLPVKVAQELLGHSSASMTLDVYSHVVPGAFQQAAGTMDRLLTAGTAQEARRPTSRIPKDAATPAT